MTEHIEDDAALSSKVDQKYYKATYSGVYQQDNDAISSDVVQQDVYRRRRLKNYLSQITFQSKVIEFSNYFI